MNWYKKTQQENFPFLKDMPKQKATPIEESPQYQKLVRRTPILLQNLLDKCETIKDAIQILKLYGFKFQIANNIISVNINNKIYIINDAMVLIDATERN